MQLKEHLKKMKKDVIYFSNVLMNNSFTLHFYNLENFKSLTDEWKTFEGNSDAERFECAVTKLIKKLRQDIPEGSIITYDHYPEIRKNLMHWEGYFDGENNGNFDWELYL